MDSYDFRRAVTDADQETENTVPVVVWVNGRLYGVESVEFTEEGAPRITIRASALAGPCPTECDDDCGAECHEYHYVRWRRQHEAGSCLIKKESP